MNHNMSLYETPFNRIKSGSKLIEVRLNDEKRQCVQIGDTITFQKLSPNAESIKVLVVDKYNFGTFKDLYAAFDFELFGCNDYTMDRMVSETYDIYTREQEQQYGVLGIRIKLVETR